MFEFKTRTETVNGCRFYEQDVLLYDYVYSGDTVIECLLDYNIPGFGFVLSEENDTDISDWENIFVIKFGKRNQYQIINKQVIDQELIRDEYIQGGEDIAPPMKGLRLLFKFTNGDTFDVSLVRKDEDGINIESPLIRYQITREIKSYKLGFYSNGGNVLKFAAIQSEAPSNWISNIFNGNGGRINWIENGFEIQDCEFDCEVESQLNYLEAGDYYFDFVCDNPDIKYYIYPSYLKDTDDRRPTEEILETRKDEMKNILDYEDDNKFTLEENGYVNIKFKGKWGTIKNICIKKHKDDGFVATDMDTIKREGSRIEFDLNKIVKIEMTANISSLPHHELTEQRRYDVFKLGPVALAIEDLGIELNKDFDAEFNVNNRILKVNNNSYNYFEDTTETVLTALNNVNAIVTKLIVTTAEGETIDIIFQKTIRITVSKNIHTPIIVTDLEYNPLDLSTAYREVIEESKTIDLFNPYVPISLKHRLCLNDSNIRVAGINDGPVDLTKSTLEELGVEYDLISYNYYTVNYELDSLKIDPDVRKKYKYIAVEYNHCDNYKYEFTNYEREIYDLKDGENITVEYNVRNDILDPMVVYGIPKGEALYKDLIYRVKNKTAVNSIDYCAPRYNLIPSDQYYLTSSNRLTFEDGIREQYDYFIIDYLKDESYSINEREKYYEIEISTAADKCMILYDATEQGTTNDYKVLNLTDLRQDNFIVLRKQERLY